MTFWKLPGLGNDRRAPLAGDAGCDGTGWQAPVCLDRYACRELLPQKSSRLSVPSTKAILRTSLSKMMPRQDAGAAIGRTGGELVRALQIVHTNTLSLFEL
jgi:hypothetical protein